MSLSPIIYSLSLSVVEDRRQYIIFSVFSIRSRRNNAVWVKSRGHARLESGDRLGNFTRLIVFPRRTETTERVRCTCERAETEERERESESE